MPGVAPLWYTGVMARPWLPWLVLALSVLTWPGEGLAARPEQGITWLGHASFKIARGGIVLYVDPWRLTEAPHDADVVLITHPHFDHLSVPDIRKVAKDSTVFIGPPDCLGELKGDRRPIAPGQQITLEHVTVEAVPAYNTAKPYHPKAKQWVGYVIEVDKVRIYHAGDTDVIPEMRQLAGVDVALLPVSGAYVMSAAEAGLAANLLDPQVAIPMHYGAIVGTNNDARRFEEECRPIPVKILPAPSRQSSDSAS